MPAALQPAACFGKTPRHGDFVRVRVSDALRAFDEWTGRAVYQGRRQPKFDAAYDAGAAVRFVWAPPRAASALVGAFAPSRDRSGRRYPFIVGAEVAGPCSAGEVLERRAPFFDAAAALAADAAAGELDHYALVERLAEVDAAPARPASRALDRRLSDVAADVWGDPDDARRDVLFDNLVRVLQGAEDGLRFPLGPTPAADARVWLTMLERMAETSPSVFAVYEGGPAVGPPNLVAYTGPPHLNALLHLLLAGTDADGVVELETPRGPAAGAGPAVDGRMTMREVMDRL